MTIVSGIRSGLRSGIRSGINPAGGASWASDATSGIAVPSSGSQWSAFLAANSLSIAAPDSLWLCQETSGNLADSIGSLALVPNASPSYNQSVTGWSRKAVQLTQVSNQRFGLGVGAGPNPSSTSVTWMILAQVTDTPAATRGLLAANMDVTTVARMTLNSTPRIITQNGTIATGTNNPVGFGVQPFAIKVDRTASAVRGYTGQEKLSPTYTSPADGTKGIGASGQVSAPADVLYACMWSGNNAEISDANMKALLEAMGFTIPWS
jgi:hypothetical protein